MTINSIYRDDISYIVRYNGKVHRFDWISQRVGRYLKTGRDQKLGILETSGREICPPRYNKIGNLLNLIRYGIVPVEGDNGWGLLNTNGKEVIKTEYFSFSIFEVGDNVTTVVVLRTKDGHKALYFPERDIITSDIYISFNFKDTYIESISENGNGVILYSGTEIFEPIYTAVKPFYYKSSIFMAKDSSGKLYLGEERWQHHPKADKFFIPVNDRIRALNGTRYAFYDALTGKNLTKFIYKEAEDFDDLGFAIVTLGGDIRQIINKNGEGKYLD